MAAWRNCKLGDLLEIKHGFAFKGEFFADSGEFVLLTPGNFKEEGGLKLKGEKEKFYSGEIPTEYLLKKGDLILAMTDLIQNAPILGSSASIPEDGRFLHNQRLGKVINIRVDWVLPEFLYYLFNTSNVRAQVKGSATGSTVRHTAPTRIYDVSVLLPPLPHQQRIAGILSAYDDLIENSQRRIKILESMTRALYREWFVNFRFPGHEGYPRVPSPLGDIPKGWEVRNVGDAVEVSGGGTPSRKEPAYWEGGTIQWYSPSDLTAAGTTFMDDSSDHITPLGLAESSARMFPARSVMLTSRATIGAIAINCHEATTNQGFITCVPNKRVPLYFLFHWLTENVPTFQRMASGSTFKEISRGVFKTIDFIHPPEYFVRRFEELVAPMAEQILALQRQVQNLRRTRDLLLPRLLSGQTDISAGLPEEYSLPTPVTAAPPARSAVSPIPVAAAPEATAPRPQQGLAPSAPARDDLELEAVLAMIRQLFGDRVARDRDTALRDLAQSLGYQRLGKRIKEDLSSALLTAVRRGILKNDQGEYALNFRSLEECDRDSLKADFLSSLGRAWIPRTEAIQSFARHLGFARVGHIIDDTARSLINGLIREGRLETDGPDRIRRT